MKYLLLSLLILLSAGTINAQVTSTANSDSGSGYPALIASGFQIEDPDCVHTDFGPHVTQAYDAELDRNVFVFHSHIDEDNDRCQVFDRVRMEIKGSSNTIPELRHNLGDTTYYRWKFRLDEDFIGASSFNHLYQNKAVGGSDSSFPVITITARTDRVELRHNGGDTGSDLGNLAVADISHFRGKWVECYLRQVHAENGEIYATIKDMNTGITILEYENNDIDLWRTGANLTRPKWGVYRSKNSVLRDEEVRFANFCVSEVSEDLCPGEAVLQPDTEAPTAPLNLEASIVTASSLQLDWDAATDEYGVTSYEVFQDGNFIEAVTDLTSNVTGLDDATEYTFTVTAKDAAGNISIASNAVVVMTVDASSPPVAAVSPFPANNATDVSPAAALSWTGGATTDSYQLFFGTGQNPPLVASQPGNAFAPEMEVNTTYFWRVVSINGNGETSSPEWTFITGESNQDFPWEVYRATARMEIETDFWDINAEPDNPMVDEVVVDPNGSGNTFYSYFSENDNFRWRYPLSELDTTLTIVARFKGVAADIEGICYFDVRMNGWRQKVRVSQSTIKLERVDPVFEEDGPFNWVDEMHLLRMVVNGPVTTIYLDENPVPFTTITSNTEISTNYFEWGKSGGTNYGATIDWMVVDKTGAYAPGEGSALPSDLFLSSDATLTEITVDGVEVENFNPYIFEYTVPVATTEVPAVDYELSSDLATTFQTDPPAVPNTAATVEVTAQDGFTVRTYTINYEQASSTTEQIDALAIKLSPNPTSQFLQITTPESTVYRGRIYSLDGKAIGSDLELRNGQSINVSHLTGGVYLLNVYSTNNRTIGLRFVVK